MNLVHNDTAKESAWNVNFMSVSSIGAVGKIGASFCIFRTAGQIAGSVVFLSFIILGLIASISTYSFAQLDINFSSIGSSTEFVVKELRDNILNGGMNILLWLILRILFENFFNKSIQCNT